ncbi:MAG: nitrilase family protein [Candidatus Pseudobacter hemicellulosilyticus]|uniref:Nitrilase family protein n=1 Tax=Candidatus Pseudobacter hemicellulosilyticus TaxID=3121375 RepID=A0AAJ5WT55_9BACT|nr:MAG: nitrilase family protein [Pseudobacter sp.]
MSSLTVSLIQSNLHWEDKAANLQQLEKKILAIERPQLVVLPEMFSTGFSMKPALLAETMDGPAVQWMRELAARKRVILTGSLIIEEGGHYFNRLIWMLPNGQLGYYDKRHLFGYAGEHEKYTPGAKRLIATVNGWRVNLQVCYDLRFPVWARQQLYPAAEGAALEALAKQAAQQTVLPEQQDNGSAENHHQPSAAGRTDTQTAPGSSQIKNTPTAQQPAFSEETVPAEYDLLVYVANWPERRNHAWKTLLQARAIENQCYVIGVNRVGNDGNNYYHSGDSMLVDPLGEVLFTKAHEEVVYTTTLEKEKLEGIRSKLPFLKDADDFMISG